jgi:hypothetical protein
VKKAPTYVGQAGGEVAKERLVQFMRYSTLVSAQEVALDAEDYDRFNELSHEISRLRDQIGPAVSLAERDAAAQQDTRDAVDVLREAVAVNQRIQARLKGLKQEHAGRIRSVTRRGPQARRYVDEGSEVPVSKLDLKL